MKFSKIEIEHVTNKSDKRVYENCSIVGINADVNLAGIEKDGVTIVNAYNLKYVGIANDCLVLECTGNVDGDKYLMTLYN